MWSSFNGFKLLESGQLFSWTPAGLTGFNPLNTILSVLTTKNGLHSVLMTHWLSTIWISLQLDSCEYQKEGRTDNLWWEFNLVKRINQNIVLLVISYHCSCSWRWRVERKVDPVSLDNILETLRGTNRRKNIGNKYLYLRILKLL